MRKDKNKAGGVTHTRSILEVDSELHPHTETKADLYRALKPKYKFKSSRMWWLFIKCIDVKACIDWKKRQIEFSDGSTHNFTREGQTYASPRTHYTNRSR